MASNPGADPAAEPAAGIVDSESAVADVWGSAVAATPTLAASDGDSGENWKDEGCPEAAENQ